MSNFPANEPHVIRRIRRAHAWRDQETALDSAARPDPAGPEFTIPQMLQASARLEISLLDLLDPLAAVPHEVSWLSIPGWARRPATVSDYDLDSWVRLWHWLQTAPSYASGQRDVPRSPLVSAFPESDFTALRDPQVLEMNRLGLRVGRSLRVASRQDPSSVSDISLLTAAEHVLGIPVWRIDRTSFSARPSAADDSGGFVAAWDDRVVAIVEQAGTAAAQDHIVALAILYMLGVQEPSHWEWTALQSPRAVQVFADGVRAGFADRGRPPPKSSGVPQGAPVLRVGPRLWAPSLAHPLNAALLAGRISTRKAARVLGMDVCSLRAWLEGHGISPDFEL